MSLSLNEIFIKKFATDNDVEAIAPEIYAANRLIRNKNGEGSDFLGWLTLPEDYDKEEFARIKNASERISFRLRLSVASVTGFKRMDRAVWRGAG